MENGKIISEFLDLFISDHKEDKIHVTGILGFGSRFSNMSLRLNSDLDLYVTIKDTQKRYRGVTLINGVEVDYFINPMRLLREQWERYKSGKDAPPFIVSMLAEGVVVQDCTGEIGKLQDEVKQYLVVKMENNVPSGSLSIRHRYFIRDHILKIEQALSCDDFFSWQQNMNVLLELLSDVYCALHKISFKKNIYKKEIFFPKHQSYVDKYNAVVCAENHSEQTERVKELAIIVVSELGGELSPKWEIAGEA